MGTSRISEPPAQSCDHDLQTQNATVKYAKNGSAAVGDIAPIKTVGPALQSSRLNSALGLVQGYCGCALAKGCTSSGSRHQRVQRSGALAGRAKGRCLDVLPP